MSKRFVRSAVVAAEASGWSDIGWRGWADLNVIRSRLDAGADPNSGLWFHGRPLHAAAEIGSPEVVAELAGRVDDVGAEHDGRTALWQAVFTNRPDNARILVAAGADPWRPMMAGWSPGRLSLASPTPTLFEVPSGVCLSAAETTAVAEARSAAAALGGFDIEGLGLACVTDLNAAAVARLLDTQSADDAEVDEISKEPWANYDESLTIVGVTDVPGGCIITQPWGYLPSTPGVTKRVSISTVCYALYANPKSGNQGSVTRGGVVEQWDTHPGGGTVPPDGSAEEILATYLYQHQPVAYCCAGAGLRLTDARSIIGPPDEWFRLPERDYWN